MEFLTFYVKNDTGNIYSGQVTCPCGDHREFCTRYLPEGDEAYCHECNKRYPFLVTFEKKGDGAFYAINQFWKDDK